MTHDDVPLKPGIDDRVCSRPGLAREDLQMKAILSAICRGRKGQTPTDEEPEGLRQMV
jgi:hypothetical protein